MFANARPPTQVTVQTLPAGYYTDPGYFQRELRRIHQQMWLFAGHADQLKASGDYFLYRAANAEVIVLRDEQRQLRAFHNVCRHRGTLLVKEPEGKFDARVQCPYHAWTYRLDGTLAQAPHMEKVDGFRVEDYPLQRVHLAVWDSLIFVSLAQQPLRFDLHLDGLDVRFRNWRMAELKIVDRKIYPVRANWKLIVQNYHECLHCPVAHPLLNRRSHFLSGDNEPPRPTYLGARMELRPGVETLSMLESPERAPLPGLTDDERRHVYYYAVLPNLLINLHPDYVVTFRFDPVAPDRTNIVCTWLMHPTELARPGFSPADAVEFWDLTNRQDWELSDRAQEGISSLGYQPGPYSNREELLAGFDRWVLERVGSLEG